MTNDVPDFNPPGAERVARRALILVVVACRGSIESDAGNPEASAFWQRVSDWFETLRLKEEMEPCESDLLATPLGRLDARKAIDASWRAEGAAVLAWALSRFELPPHDELCESQAVADRLGFLRRPLETVLARPCLRSIDEIGQYREVAFSVHWRLREHSLNPRRLDFEELARTAWFGPLELGGLPLVDGDLGIRGRSIGEASLSDLQRTTSIAQERHHAAIWLSGECEGYSEVSTEP